MAEFEYVPDPTPDTNENPTWGDYGKSVASGVTSGALAPAAAGVRYATQDDTSNSGRLTNEMARILQRQFNQATDDINESRTDVARKRAEAAVTSADFWEHPVSGTMLKAAGMSGPLAVAVFSGGPVGAAIVSGALSTGSFLNELDKSLDAASDADLRNNAYYSSLRDMGLDEAAARNGLKSKVVANKDVLNFAIGSLAGALGPAGKAAAGVAGKTAVGLAGAEAGLLKRAGVDALEGAVTEAAQEGTEDATTQTAQVEAGVKKEFDKTQLANAVAEGVFLGGVTGGAVGAVTGGRGKAKAEEIKAKKAAREEPAVTPEVKPEDVTNQTQNGRTGGEVPPVEAQIGDKQNQPTGSETQYPKTKGRKTQGPEVEVVEAGAPTVAETAAVADLQQKTQPAPAPIAAQPVVEQAAPAPTLPPGHTALPGNMARDEHGVEYGPLDRTKPMGPDEAPPIPSTSPVPAEIVPSPPAAVATPEPAKPVEPAKPRVLQNISPEAKALAKAGNEQLKKNIKAAETEPKEASGERKRGEAEKAILEEREKHAREVFQEHAPDRGDAIPVKREERDAMAKQLAAMLEAAATRGLVARENLPADVKARVFPPKKKNGEAVTRTKPTPEEYRAGHLSIPQKVAGAGGHVMYLREAMAIKRILEKASPLTKSDKDRIQKFVVEERDFKAGRDDLMAARRKEDGERNKRQEQGDVEAPAGKVAKAMEELGNSDHVSPEEKMIQAEEQELPDGVEIKQGPSVKHIEVKPVERVKLNAAEKRAARKAAFAKPAPKAIPAPVAEKKPVIAATSDAAVTRAGKETNTNPTEAQKTAGNYAKGTVDWNGLKVAIENPRDSVRKGMAKIGGIMREWSVKMQDHYGYIKRSEGADGDQVDVFMGPNPKSDQVWVIHQQDFNGKFDEHKAMLGYDSQAEAMSAYDRAFSDNRGFERIKDIEAMSVQEFKDWVHSDKPKKAKKEAAAADIESDLRTELPIKSRMAPGQTVHSEYVKPARDVLDALNFEHLTGVPRAIADIARRHMKTMVGDVDVHVVNATQMAELTGDVADAFANLDQGTLGKAHLRQADGKTTVILRADQFSTPERTAHAAMHEITHAWTMRALVEDPLLYKRVTRMMAETRSFLEDLPDIREKVKYALTDEREFIAEAFSNPEVQQILSQIPMSTDLQQTLGMHMQRPSMWDAVVGMVRNIIEKLSGRIPEGHRMIEGILRLSKDFDTHTNKIKARRILGVDTSVKPHAEFDQTANLVAEVKGFIDSRIKGEGLQEQDGKPWKWSLKLRTMDQLAQAAADYFSGNNPVRRVADLVEMIRVKAAANLRKSEPIIDELYSLEKKYKGKVWEDFTSLVHDETMANVFADRDLAGNAHLGKDTLDGAWSKEQHADLAARYAELPEDLKAARAKAMKFFTDQQNAMSLGIIKNRILKVLGVNDDALARRIHEGRTVDTDADLVGGQHTLDLIKEAKELAKISGPYFPLMRRGDHVVRATYDIAAPANATKIEDNVFEFSGPNARKAALDWVKKQDTRPSVVSRWVDKNTGDTRFPDGTKVTKSDTDAEQRFRVTVQNRHVEFFDSAREAQEAAFELAKQGGLHVKGVEERRFEPGDRQADMLSSQMQSLVEGLKRREGYKDLNAAQKNELVQALNEASLRFLGSTRIQSRRLPRRYVEGASNDLTRNTLEYAQSSSGYLAKLEHQPDLEDALKKMREAVGEDEHKTKSLGRSAIANEIERRVAASNNYDEGGTWNAVTKRIMTLSFLDKLFGPSHNIINSLQPSMVTFPVLAGRYGVGKSFDALSRAYRDVSGLGIVKQGIKDTIKKAKDGSAKTTDLLGDIKKNLSAKEREMLDYLAARGAIDPDAGFEIERLVKARAGVAGKLDQGLGYFEGIARQMPQVIEMMNRSVSALATYRLEMGRGASHEAAMAKAQETVNNTQGLYSASNQAPIFGHPVAKLSLQFKKFAQLQYHLLGSNIGKALKNANPGDRAEAIKTLAGITATHVAMAGALGLPTEPFKYLLMGAQAAGLTSTGWGDVENKVRETATNFFGKTGGEVLTKGLPRLAGIDLSSRVGLDSLSSFSEPKSNKDTDVKSWIFDTLAGAPAALVSDWVKGMNNLMAGNFVKAGEQLVPLKFAADSIRAYRMSTEGKKGSTGKETMRPYNPLEAVVRVAGFTPAREAEEGAKRSAFYSIQKRDTAERSELMTAWVTAKPSEKLDAWKRVQKFNKGRPRDEQISMSDLSRAADRRRREGDAIKTSKRDERHLRKAESTYNY